MHPSVEAVESELEAFRDRTVFVIRHAQVPNFHLPYTHTFSAVCASIPTSVSVFVSASVSLLCGAVPA